MQVPRSVQLGGLAALAIADVALVVAIMRPATPAASEPPRPSTSATSPATSTSTATSTAGATTSSVAAMAVVSDQVAYRAAAAGCSVTTPGLQKTTNGGRSWTPVTVDGPGSIVRIEFTSASEGFVVGTTKDCELRVWRTSSSGAEWTGPTPAGEFWSSLPGDTSKVNSVGGARTPCASGSTVVQVARVTDANTYVLCSKGVVRHTTNGGAAWTTQATVAGALALAADRQDGTRIVLAGTDGSCEGTRIWSLAESADSAQSRACLPGAKPTGAIALDAGGSSVWLTVGDKAWRAGADLNSWGEG